MSASLLLLLALGGAAATAQPPVVYAERTADYDVELRITPDLQSFPAAYARARGTAMAEIAALKSQAMADKPSRHRPGTYLSKPLVERIEIESTVATPHLAGFMERLYFDSHGAHPGFFVGGLLIDRATQQPIGERNLLRLDARTAPFDVALQAAVARARIARDGREPAELFTKPIWGMVESPGPNAPAAEKGLSNDATLAPSTTPGRAGGLAFLYSPYEITSFGEGPYRVVLPATIFLQALKPEYRADFAPEPVGPPSSNPWQGFPSDLPP